MMRQTVKYVIFDIDGTLADTKKVEDRCFMSAFYDSFGINIEQQRWEDLENVTDWGITEEIILRERGRKPTQQEYDLMISKFVKLLKVELDKDATQFSEVPGAKSFFDRLRVKDDIHLGIATGSWEQSAKVKLDAIGIATDGISFSNSDYFKSRENITRDVIRQISTRHSAKPGRIIYFGDGAWDYYTCNNLGIEFIGIDVEGDGKLKELGAETIFNNFLAPHDILAKIEDFE